MVNSHHDSNLLVRLGYNNVDARNLCAARCRQSLAANKFCILRLGCYSQASHNLYVFGGICFILLTMSGEVFVAEICWLFMQLMTYGKPPFGMADCRRQEGDRKSDQDLHDHICKVRYFI